MAGWSRDTGVDGWSARAVAAGAKSHGTGIGADSAESDGADGGTAGCRSMGTQHERAAGLDCAGAWQQGITAWPAGAPARHGAADGAMSATSAMRTTKRTNRLPSTARHSIKPRAAAIWGEAEETSPIAAGNPSPCARAARKRPEIARHRRCTTTGRENREMASRHRDSITPLTAVTGVAGMLFGVIVGYMLGVSRTGAGLPPVTAVQTTAAAAAPALVNEQEVQGWRNILATDPKNLRANIELGNRLYDGARYAEAVPYYRQAFAADPKNVSVSTDLATALYYAGKADEALAQFDRSLANDPKHGQTLFNMGIVKRDARNDRKGAIALWERLLTAVPDYPDAAKVRTMIAELKTRVS
jgi:cytochrome c-type biogenesis protein CcmH/NrfG